MCAEQVISRGFRTGVLAVLLLSPLAATALTATPPAPTADERARGAEWVTQPVRAPVALEDVRARAPHVPQGVPEVAGPASLNPGQAAALWIAPLTVVRVSCDCAQPPTFARVIGDGATIEETPERGADGSWLLVQEPGGGGAWAIRATSPATLRVEKARVREGALVWDDLRHRVLESIAKGEALPPAEAIAGWSGAREELLGHEELARLVAEGADLQAIEGLKQWRKAAAIRVLDARRSAWAPGSTTRTITDRLVKETRKVGDTELGYSSGDVVRKLELEGPAVLRLEARAVLPDGKRRDFAIRVTSNGRAVGRLQRAPGLATTASDEPRAFPEDATPLVDSKGQGVSWREEVAVTLPPGKATYEIAIEGGPVLVRALRVARRPWLRESLAGERDPVEAIRAGNAAVSKSPSAQAKLVQQLLAIESGRAPVEVEGAEPVSLASKLVQATWLSASTEASARERGGNAAIEAMMILAKSGRLDASRWLRVMAGQALARSGRGLEATRVARGIPVDRPELGVPVGLLQSVTVSDRPLALATLDATWRKQPLSTEAREAYLDVWHEETRWASVPTIERRVERTEYLEVLASPESAAPRCESRSGARWLVSGDTRIHAETSAVDGNRPAVLELQALVPPKAKGPLAVSIDETQFELMPLSEVEGVSVALPPGDHMLSVIAPPGTMLVSSLPTSGLPTVRQRSAVAIKSGSTATTFRMTARAAAPVARFLLRGVIGPGGGRDATIVARTDTGATWTMKVPRLEADPSATVVERERRVLSAPIEGTLLLPGGTRELSFTSSAGEWIGSVALRTGCDDVEVASTLEARVAPKDAATPAMVRELTMKLQETPDDVALLERRANVLLDLDATGLARRDFRTLNARTDRPARDAAERLAERHEFLSDLKYLRAPEGARFELPTPLDAVLPAKNHTRELDDLVMLARSRGAAAALAKLDAYQWPGTPERDLLRAKLLKLLGRDQEAVKLFVQLTVRDNWWQPGLEALEAYDRLVDLDDPLVRELSPVIYGIASRISQHADLPLVRRAMRLSQRRSQWASLDQVIESAGVEQARASGDGAELTPSRALIPAPWSPEKGQYVEPGRAGVISVTLREKKVFELELYCGETTERTDKSATCSTELRLDGGKVEHLDLPANASRVWPIELAPGRHQLELALMTSDRALLARPRESWEGTSADLPMSPPQRTSFVASKERPVAFTVLGPATLQLDAMTADGQLPALDVLVRGESGMPIQQERFDVAGDGVVTAAVGDSKLRRVLVFPTAGPQQVQVRPSERSALVALSLRVPRDGADSEDGSAWVLPPKESTLPAIGNAFEAPRLRPERPAGFGTVSAQAALVREDVVEDDFSRPLRSGVNTSLALRREIVEGRQWLKLEPSWRVPFASESIIGGRASYFARRLPLDTRLNASAEIFRQQLDLGAATGVRGRLSIDRPFAVGDHLSLVPVVSIAGDAYRGPADEDAYDRSVFQRYSVQHTPRALGGVSLRWSPTRDHVLTLRGATVTNANLASLDRVDGGVSWHGLVELPALKTVRLGAGYELSNRFADDLRATGLLRHAFDGGVDWPAWVGKDARVLLSARDTIYVGTTSDLRQVFSIGLRGEWNGGRGLRDVAPVDEEFEDVVGRRFWMSDF